MTPGGLLVVLDGFGIGDGGPDDATARAHTPFLDLARRRHPGAPCSLDALCKRYGVDLSERDKHSALLDCRLLAAVYVELVGGHQARLDFAVNGAQAGLLRANDEAIRPRPRPIAPRLTAAEIEAHRAFVATLGADALWLRY